MKVYAPTNWLRRACLAILVLLPAAGCGESQMGPDKEAFQAVDALYTAVSLRDPKLVGPCATRLRSLQDAGKLGDAWPSLEAILAQAGSGGWEDAQARLAKFMTGQRRGR